MPWESRFKGLVDATLERLLHDEVERAKMVDAVASHLALQQPTELGLQTIRRELPLHRGEVLGIDHEHADAGGIALVAGAGMGDLAQRDDGHVSIITKPASTSCRSRYALWVITLGVI